LEEKHMPTPAQIIASAKAKLASAQKAGASPETIASIEQSIAGMEHRQAQQDADDASSHRSTLRGVLSTQVGRYAKRMQATKQILDKLGQAGRSDVASAAQQNGLAGAARGLEEAPLFLLRLAARAVLYTWNKTHRSAAITKVAKAYERAGVNRQELGMSRRQFRKAITNG
jgi:hypothetical protein